MAEGKHTPGPWELSPWSDGLTELWCVGLAGTTKVFTYCDQGPNREANAALISAAPDLLAACEDFVAADSHDGVILAYNAAIAAIAKAKGEQANG